MTLVPLKVALAIALAQMQPLGAELAPEWVELNAHAAAAEAEAVELPPHWQADELGALALTVAIFETGLRPRFQDSEPDPGWNDHGLSACAMQIHQGASSAPPQGRVTLEEWAELDGLDADALRRCYRAGVRVLAYHARRCGWRPYPDEAAAVLGAYGRGAGCFSSKASRRRGWTYARLLDLTRKAQKTAGPEAETTGPVDTQKDREPNVKKEPTTRPQG